MNTTGNRISFVKLALLKLISLAVALVLVAVLGVSPTLAQATTVTTNVQQPLDLFVFVPCAMGGRANSSN